MISILEDTYFDFEYVLEQIGDSEVKAIYRVISAIWLLPLLVLHVIAIIFIFPFFALWSIFVNPIVGIFRSVRNGKSKRV